VGFERVVVCVVLFEIVVAFLDSHFVDFTVPGDSVFMCRLLHRLTTAPTIIHILQKAAHKTGIPLDQGHLIFLLCWLGFVGFV